MFGFRYSMFDSDKEYQALKPEHRTTKIEHRKPNIKHRKPNIEIKN